jgi:hypothetical protein
MAGNKDLDTRLGMTTVIPLDFVQAINAITPLIATACAATRTFDLITAA